MNKLLCLVLLTALFPLLLRAQTKPDIKPGVFTGKNGVTYINQALPVYFYFATEDGAAAKKHKLINPKRKSMTDPVDFDKHGPKSINVTYAKDASGRRVPVNLEMFVDGKPPETKIKFIRKNETQSKGLTLYDKDLAIELSAQDDGSGLEAIYYSLNKAAFKPYTAKLTFTEEKEYTLQFFAADNVGNTENVQAHKFSIDKTPPVSESDVVGTVKDGYYGKDTKITLSAKDNLSPKTNIFYKLNGNDFREYTTPIELSEMKQGSHTLIYFARDMLGNIEDKSKAQNKLEFKIDNSAPGIAVEYAGKQHERGGLLFLGKDGAVIVEANDPGCGVDKITYKLKHEGSSGTKETKFLPYQGQISFKDKGRKIITLRATDKIGNRAEKIIEVGYDDEPPKTLIKYGSPQLYTQDTLYINANTKISLISTNYDSGLKFIKYSINNGPEQDYKEGGVNPKKDGVYLIKYYSEDNVGNQQMKSSSLFCVDNNPPNVRIELIRGKKGKGTDDKGNPITVYRNSPVLGLGTYDRCKVKDVKYSVNGSKLFDLPANGVLSTNTPNKKYRIVIKSEDSLGNTGSQTFVFLIAED